MGDDQVSTSTTGSSNPKIQSTLDRLFGKLDNTIKAGAPDVFNQSLYSPVGGTTQQGWTSALAKANDPTYGAGISDAMGVESGLLKNGGLTAGQSGNIGTANTVGNNFGNLALNGGLTSSQSGNLGALTNIGTGYSSLADAYSGDAPGYAALRAKAGDDALSSINSVFNSNGRFGGGSNVKAAGEGVASALSGLDYANFTNDINNQYRSLDSQAGLQKDQFGMSQAGVGNQVTGLTGQLGAANQAFGQQQTGTSNQQTAAAALPALYQSSLLPSATLGSVGAAQDANNQGILQGQYDLASRQNSNKTDWLSKLFALGSSGAAAGGQTTTSTTPGTPWWQSALGLGIGAAGAFL